VGVLILMSWGKVSKRILWLMFLVSFVFGSVLLPVVMSVVGTGILGADTTDLAMAYLQDDSVIEGRLLKYFIYFLNILVLVNYDKLIKRDKDFAYYIGLMCLGASLLSIFSFQSTLALRFCMFFFSVSIFLIPQLFRVLKINRLYYISFVLLFIMQIYIGSKTVRDQDNAGYSRTYPYRTIFEVYSQY